MAVDIPVSSVNFSPSADLINPESKSYSQFHTTGMAVEIFYDSNEDIHSFAGVGRQD